MCDCHASQCQTWRDRKVVRFLATVPTSQEDSGEVESSVKVNGHWEKKNFASSGVVTLYNTYVEGIGVSDQSISAYARLRRASMWYYKVFCIHTYNLYLYTIIEKAYSLWGRVIKENQIIKIRYNNKKLQFSSVHVKVKNN